VSGEERSRLAFRGQIQALPRGAILRYAVRHAGCEDASFDDSPLRANENCGGLGRVGLQLRGLRVCGVRVFSGRLPGGLAVTVGLACLIRLSVGERIRKLSFCAIASH